MTRAKLVADVGGTNARFALSTGEGNFHNAKSFRVADFRSCEAAIAAYFNSVSADETVPAAIASAAIAAAGPVDESGAIALTNAAWKLEPSSLSRAIGGGHVNLFNDLEAVALALPHLRAGDYRDIGPHIRDPLTGNLLALNVGTGLGAAAAVKAGEVWIAVASEAGHMTFAARTPREIKLLTTALSVEDVLSGDGIGRLAACLSEDCQPPAADPAPATSTRIFENAKTDGIANEATEIVTDLLARLASDLVLATGAWGGVYFTGSVANAWAGSANQEHFRTIFSDKGKMQSRMHRVPTRLITAPDPALFGLSFTD